MAATGAAIGRPVHRRFGRLPRIAHSRRASSR
jgi:hypothetical protein